MPQLKNKFLLLLAEEDAVCFDFREVVFRRYLCVFMVINVFKLSFIISNIRIEPIAL